MRLSAAILTMGLSKQIYHIDHIYNNDAKIYAKFNTFRPFQQLLLTEKYMFRMWLKKALFGFRGSIDVTLNGTLS